MKDFIGTFEAAKLCRVSPGTVTRWIKEGRLNSAVTAGGHHRIGTSDFIKFMESLRMPVPRELAQSAAFRVLIVDDEKDVRQLIRWVIETNYENVIVEEAEEGFTAGWKTRDFSPDLVILDMHMPGLNGFDFLEIIHRCSEAKSPYILVVSALDEIEKKVLEMGADDFLAKPFHVSELQKKISLLRSPRKKDANHDAA
jgi:excisionase family DNA binding protein